MANVSCGSCDDLRILDPDFIANGLGDDECASLANNTGLVTSSGDDTATDLQLMNDCLIGNLVNEIEGYEICDWKNFMDAYLPNAWTMNKAFICALAGAMAGAISDLAGRFEVIHDTGTLSCTAGSTAVYQSNLTSEHDCSPDDYIPISILRFASQSAYASLVMCEYAVTVQSGSPDYLRAFVRVRNVTETDVSNTEVYMDVLVLKK